ncbi:MAG: hypothetical protein VKJ02_04035 [Snowella sp.]|nr:hypothetical protein [Snowella sp.]
MSEKSIKEFARIIKTFSSNSTSYLPICNISFFLGAGFSKAWDQRSPIGSELFDLNTSTDLNAKKYDVFKLPDLLSQFLISHDYYSVRPHPKELQLKDIMYNLSMQLKYPDLRSRYIDAQNIQLIINEIKSFIQQKFENITEINYFDEKLSRFPYPNNLNEDQRAILNFFKTILSDTYSDRSRGIYEGIRSDFITTNYDFTIETILNYIWGEDDSIFLYIYRGITPEEICGCHPYSRIVSHDYGLTKNLIKINGGFEILANENFYKLEYRKRKTEDILKNPPQIMLPNKEQDYTDNYFKAVFPKAVRLLQESQVLVIVGYSMPEEDSLIRILLRQFAEKSEDLLFKNIFYITGKERKNEDYEKTYDERYQKLKQLILSLYPYLNNKKQLLSSIFIYPGHFCDWAKGVIEELT